MQRVTAFVGDRGVLRQCPEAAAVALVDALTRKSSPVVVVQTEGGVVSQVSLQDCTHATLTGTTLYLFDKDATHLVLVFQSQAQASKFAEGIAKHIRLVGAGGLDTREALRTRDADSGTERDEQAQILEILRDPSFPEYVDAVEKILCRMIAGK